MSEKKGYVVTPEKHVIVCIPYYRCRDYVRRAVQTLLAQTYSNITVVVVNDGDFETPPWPVLSDIFDTRLVRFDIRQNKGPYFATQLVLSATTAPYLLIQDADDWSHPERIQKLLTALDGDKADFAISAQSLIREDLYNSDGPPDIRWIEKLNGALLVNNPADKYKVNTKLTRQFLYRSAHHGLFRTEVLRKVGGYYGGFRTSYDTLLINFILMVGKIAHVPEPLYYRLIRPTSLTQSAETGYRSIQRKQILLKLEGIYNSTYKLYRSYLGGEMTGDNLIKSIRSTCENYIPGDDLQAISSESKLLKQSLFM
ncbi:MAG: glycosyltransferase family 2 protein [Ginsengibacter sp.]